MNQTLNTKIVLRNSTTAEWESVKDTAVLLKGEIGIEFNPNATADSKKVKFKIGDSIHAWADLPYFGCEENKTFQVGALSEITDDDLTIGDTAIVKTAIYVDAEDESKSKYSYTGYVWNGTNWAAMDGNVDSTNVYFNDDITLAGAYTAVGNVTKASAGATGVLSAKGKSLAEVMQSIFTQELYPATGSSRDLPNISISGLSDTSGEVGSSYTLPTATVKVDDVGAYTYGPATGIKFEVGKVTLAQGAIATATNKATNSSVMVAGNTFTLTATDTETLYTDSEKTYTFNASGEYTQGAMPVTNLGNDYPDARIAAGTATATAKSAKRTGYRYMFAGGTAATTVDSAIVRAFTAKKNSKPTSEGTALEFTAAGGTTKVVCAFPNSYTGTPYFEMFGLAWAENTNFKAKSDIQVADARGTVDGVLKGAMTYKVYAWELETPLEAETTKFRVYFK